MANKDHPMGLKPVRTLSGVYTGAVNPYQIADTYNSANSGIFTGDTVQPLSTGYIRLGEAAPTVDTLGVFAGCNYVDPGSGTPTWKAYYPDSTNITVGIIEALICDDPMVVFEVQCDGILTIADVFSNATVTITDGDTASGTSRFELDHSEVATTSTDPLKIIGLSTNDENSDQSVANGNAYVIINNHTLKSVGTDGI
jgi:hypothetical protein